MLWLIQGRTPDHSTIANFVGTPGKAWRLFFVSTTDPDSRSMKDKAGRSKPNYNTQVGVDDAAGAIVAAEVDDEPDDSGQLTPMVEQVAANCGDQPQSISADSRYNTGSDLAVMEERQIDCYLPAPDRTVQRPRCQSARKRR